MTTMAAVVMPSKAASTNARGAGNRLPLPVLSTLGDRVQVFQPHDVSRAELRERVGKLLGRVLDGARSRARWSRPSWRSRVCLECGHMCLECGRVSLGRGHAAYRSN